MKLFLVIMRVLKWNYVIIHFKIKDLIDTLGKQALHIDVRVRRNSPIACIWNQ